MFFLCTESEVFVKESLQGFLQVLKQILMWLPKMHLAEGFFISGSLELLKEQILTIMICMIFLALISFIIF